MEINEKEKWRPVVGYDGRYEVSNFGRVKSFQHFEEKFLKLQKNRDGYFTVLLYKNRTKKRCQVQRIVWEAFNGKIPEGMQIDHINTVRVDNRLENLRCVTPKENISNPITAKRRAEWNKRLVQDPEWLKKNAEANKRKAQDPEWRKNVAEANKRKAQDPEWLRKTSEANRRKAQDPEWLRNVSETMKRIRSKPVNQYTLDGEFVKTWSSATEAAKELGIQKSSISQCINGKRYIAGGFAWRMAQ